MLKIDDKLVTNLDYILFKEKTHLKRGSGFTQIPEKLLKHTKCENMDIKNTIKHIFLRLFDINIDINKKKEIEKTEKKEEIMEKAEKKELKKRQLIIEE